ncbi:hypothetical protein E2562_013099 [Oryza meyeriana var. granulata]|uniref:Uncharacterized protein n=1 Tax=Oryza meyeriana var. granulata TaxID=110450 RepID=A0A6G1F7T6_9ORYZ|nr:hypothetical protein E2562_013099 [Oryza meyeriana var. granulata]
MANDFVSFSVVASLDARLVVVYIIPFKEVALMHSEGMLAGEISEVADCLQPVINLLAYYLTVLRRFDVDQPRNLAKSVTAQ